MGLKEKDLAKGFSADFFSAVALCGVPSAQQDVCALVSNVLHTPLEAVLRIRYGSVVCSFGLASTAGLQTRLPA
jgi:hypothetical protein